MAVSTLILAVSFVLLMTLSAFFSSTETAFFALGPLELRQITLRHAGKAQQIQRIMSRPTEFLSTVLIGNTIVNIALAAVGFALAEKALPLRGEGLSIPIVTFLLIIFGEAGPKRFGLLLPTQLACLYAPVVSVLISVLRPLRLFVERITRSFEPLFIPRGRLLTEEELESVLDLSEEQGVINEEELAMIKAIIHLEDLRARDVMTPRVDIIGLDLENPDLAQYLKIARESRRNYLVLYSGQLDRVEGFLDVRRFLLDPQHSVEAARLPPYFVPESSPLNKLLVQFQAEKRRIAIVADEFGGTAGVITRGDILEEITGEIYNELSKPRAVFQSAGPHRWIVDPNIRLEEINRRLRLNLKAEGTDRLSGWIAEKLGRIPTRDDVVETEGCRITVLQTIRQRVTLVMVEKLGERA